MTLMKCSILSSTLTFQLDLPPNHTKYTIDSLESILIKVITLHSHLTEFVNLNVYRWEKEKKIVVTDDNFQQII